MNGWLAQLKNQKNFNTILTSSGPNEIALLEDGYGNVVADLGSYETMVKEQLQWGETKRHIAVQAFAVDLCGDSREELVLYQPYNGQAIFIFTQPDSNGKAKPYVHEKDAYNIRSYF